MYPPFGLYLLWNLLFHLFAHFLNCLFSSWFDKNPTLKIWVEIRGKEQRSGHLASHFMSKYQPILWATHLQWSHFSLKTVLQSDYHYYLFIQGSEKLGNFVRFSKLVPCKALVSWSAQPLLFTSHYTPSQGLTGPSDRDMHEMVTGQLAEPKSCPLPGHGEATPGKG